MVENTQSSSCTVETNGAGRYFSAQLATLWPNRVQNTAMHSAVTMFAGAYPVSGVRLMRQRSTAVKAAAE